MGALARYCFPVRKILSLIRLIRLHNCLIAGVGVWMGNYLASPGPASNMMVYLAAVAAALVCGAGNALNDFLDIDADRINHPDRPLPSGRVPAYYAILIVIVFNTAALILAALVNLPVFLIVLGAELMLVLYNYQLKKMPLSGNIAVSVLGSATFIVGACVGDCRNVAALPGPLVPAVFAFLFHFARELVKDKADIEGDGSAAYRTLPIIMSGKAIAILIIALFAILIGLTLVPVGLGWYRPVFNYLVIIAVDLPLVIVLAAMFIKYDRQRIRLTCEIFKILMIVGLLAFFLGKKAEF